MNILARIVSANGLTHPDGRPLYEPDSKLLQVWQALTSLRVVRRMWATLIHASLEAMAFSHSFANRRQRPSHAKVRSTTHRPGEDFEAFGGIGALDDFERPLSDHVQCAAQFRPGIGAIGEQVARKRCEPPTFRLRS